ncbi:MAG: ketopantoate reductase family protein [Acidobacteriales bacterium]|nr:ketopantoate reductase family protein [Terriglobales bacterium]
MKILVLGAGAIGGFYGGHLLAAGRDVTFLVRARRATQLAKRGLDIESAEGNLHINNPPAVLAEEIKTHFDLVLVSCKAYDLPNAIESFSAAVGPNTVILPLLNGMYHLKLLDDRFGKNKVLGGKCFISAALSADGRVLHLNDADRLTLGERDGSLSTRVQQIADALGNAGFAVEVSRKILQDMWQKWVFIAAAAGSASLMGGSVGDMVAAGADGIALSLLQECASVAESEGFPPSTAFLEATRSQLTAAGSTLIPSMLRDIDHNAPIETETIIGDMFRRGSAHGLSLELLEIVYARLRCYEIRRAAAAASLSTTQPE